MAFQFREMQNRIYLEDERGNCIAEVLFPAVAEGIVSVEHTLVDSSLRGQGVAGELLKTLVRKLRFERKKAKLTCTYAIKWFATHPEFSDVLAREDVV